MEKIKDFEGCRLEAYQDAAGVWTIGYGHTKGVHENDRIDQFRAEELLKEDLEQVEKQVLELNVCRTQAQLDALVSFVFNVGIGRLKTSQLLKLLRADFVAEVVTREWNRWAYANGRRLKGLVSRRRWEAKRYFEHSDSLNDVRYDQAKAAETKAAEA